MEAALAHYQRAERTVAAGAWCPCAGAPTCTHTDAERAQLGRPPPGQGCPWKSNSRGAHPKFGAERGQLWGYRGPGRAHFRWPPPAVTPLSHHPVYVIFVVILYRKYTEGLMN
jgi:hypothetical protein